MLKKQSSITKYSYDEIFVGNKHSKLLHTIFLQKCGIIVVVLDYKQGLDL